MLPESHHDTDQAYAAPLFCVRCFCKSVKIISILALAHVFVMETLAAVSLDQPGGRRRDMNRQYETSGAGSFVQELAPRLSALLLIPVEHRRPIRLTALYHVVHEIADHDG